ncbi:MAG: ACT domain-containing protein, partial [Candidatus Sedimenticola sp. 6PFRAG5]
WLELKDEPSESEDFVDNIKTEFEAQQIYVLTPQGKVMELPKGATAVDFAYAIHSDVGNRCRGARINGRIAPLTQPLESGQTVEVITVKEGGPSRDWLSPHLGYLKTSKARNRIRHWFKQQDYEEHLHLGRTSLEREITRLGVSKPDLGKAAQRFNMKRGDDLLAAIGRGEVSPVQVAGMGERQTPASAPDFEEEIPVRKRGTKKKHRKGQGEVIVEGVDDLMTHMARCCKPVPYDGITGFITRGRGVTVHRKDCKVIKKLDDSDEERLVRVVWADQPSDSTYPVDIRVFASDRKGLLRDISSILTNEEVDVQGVNTQSDRKNDRATMKFTIEISDMRQLSRILEKVSQLPDVLDVRRQV